MRKFLLGLTVVGSLWSWAPASAQGDSAAMQSRWAAAEQAYAVTFDKARQIIVVAPQLNDGSFVNAMKRPLNFGIPVTLVTTEQGLLARNGHLFSLVLIGARTLLRPQGTDSGQFIQVEEASGRWSVYEFSGGRPVRVPFARVQAFNRWYAANASKAGVVDPVQLTAAWAKGNLGVTLYTPAPPKR